MSIFRFALAGAIICVAPIAALAATSDPAELSALKAEADRNGAAAVLVNLDNVTLGRLATDGANTRAKLQLLRDQLASELGSEAWRVGRWDSGLGQIGLYATRAGLDILSRSKSALSFQRDPSAERRLHMDQSDGRLANVRAQLDKAGFVDLRVIPAVDGLQYHQDRTGALSLKGASEFASAYSQQSQRILAELGNKQLLNRAAATAEVKAQTGATASSQDGFTVRVNREGFVALAHSDAVLGLLPVGFADKRERTIGREVVSAISSGESVRVIVTLRMPLENRRMSNAAAMGISASAEGILREVAASVGIAGWAWMIPEFGVFAATLTPAEIERLIGLTDARILHIGLNQALGELLLNTSTPTMNVTQFWGPPAPSYVRGAGQSIIVIDSSVERDTPFLRDAAGVSRVSFEGCWGTTGVSGGNNYITVCPTPNADGDSALGTVGASQPPYARCTGNATTGCLHGTHVAGIAAGRSYAGAPPGVQGVAPDANIIGLQVFSYSPTNAVAPTYFTEDLLLALQAVVQNAPGSPASPFVVNMSLGGTLKSLPPSS
ncbi:S8 family serine peptidase [Rhodoferax sp.]|uniref:S8 family serine peptidase n=1 Tax=Rhodoferax sp. TaxID=50421 RepID=UPI0027482942|nr:S8 family serine peptidase [Rhodoferax sp.]